MIPPGFVKQNYDLVKNKGYALSDTFFVAKLCEIIEDYEVTQVVEAGTFEGRSTVELSFLVDEVIGIELDEKYVDMTTQRLIDNKRKNYKIFLGNSPDILSKIIPELDLDHVIFFLDAHLSASGKYKGDTGGYWPILDEIKTLPKNKGIIILHDIHVPFWGDLEKHNPQRLGYDTYTIDNNPQRFDYEFIKDALMDWCPTHRIEYNNGMKTSGDQRGLIFIYPY